ncbi:hypothetical protein [Streptomyces gibsoniae]|uniref:Uncharacterized protein n=1 Tax=Streptomyces gibsoniae TaxID=3075529 RepID=A0ABU2U308_9ACTN|nr:hypothetical protein [Streptomyces sp. DSM 41699]MDT0467606.1 hypothetical protein [Streptomyces sp. DSM 41699]
MQFPAIPLAVAAGTSAVGVIGNKVIADRAKKKIADLQAHHDAEHAKHRGIADSTIAQLRGLGVRQQFALDTVTPRMRAFAERNERQLRMLGRRVIEGGEAPTIREIDTSPEGPGTSGTATAMRGIASAAAGIGLSGATYASVAKVATASTGTAINTLSGAAKRNATLAVIGGGTKAAGGGGIAAGVRRLNIITAVPAVVLTVGWLIKQKSDEDKAVAQFDADVKKAVATYHRSSVLLEGVDSRIGELLAVLAGMVRRAGDALDRLEETEREPGGFDLDIDDHAHRLHTALQLVKGVVELAEAPVMNPDLTLDPSAEFLAVKYRDYNPESTNA